MWHIESFQRSNGLHRGLVIDGHGGGLETVYFQKEKNGFRNVNDRGGGKKMRVKKTISTCRGFPKKKKRPDGMR